LTFTSTTVAKKSSAYEERQSKLYAATAWRQTRSETLYISTSTARAEVALTAKTGSHKEQATDTTSGIKRRCAKTQTDRYAFCC